MDRRPAEVFRLNGLASTKVKVLRVESSQETREIAQWQFGVGDHQSPGCHFHVGIGRSGDGTGSFPVPRLPSILFTPIDALDFLLGEVVQDRWRQQVSRETPEMQIWTGQQKKRLSLLLKWKQEQVEKSGGSAWNYLKHQRPHANVFLQ